MTFPRWTTPTNAVKWNRLIKNMEKEQRCSPVTLCWPQDFDASRERPNDWWKRMFLFRRKLTVDFERFWNASVGVSAQVEQRWDNIGISRCRLAFRWNRCWRSSMRK